jgi:hypothetical protein
VVDFWVYEHFCATIVQVCTSTNFTNRSAPFLLSPLFSTTTGSFASARSLGFRTDVGASFAAYLASDAAFLSAFSACFAACFFAFSFAF